MDDDSLLEGMICIMQMIRQAPPYRGSDPPGEGKNRHHEKGIHTVCSAGDRTGLPNPKTDNCLKIFGFQFFLTQNKQVQTICMLIQRKIL